MRHAAQAGAASNSGEPGVPLIIRETSWNAAIWILLAIICGAVFLDALDVSMVAVALPSIGVSLHLSASSLQWIVNGYILGYGSFLLLGGRISDLVSRRTVFLAAVRPGFGPQRCAERGRHTGGAPLH
jgi:Major Facilitator Superfamily